MQKPLFTGACTALVTPFIHNKINFPMVDVLLRRQIEAGIPAVVVCGTTGEAPTLSDEEKIQLVTRSKQCVGDDLLVIAGSGSNNTEHAVYLSKAAQDAGADALLIVSPYYNKATADGLMAHYIAIAQAVTIPIILYNVPSRTGVDIPIKVYQQLCQVPNIVGVKEASADIEKLLRIRSACGSDFSIWTGNDTMTVPAISLGCQGVISVASNLMPRQMQDMALAAIDGDFDTASHLQLQYQDLCQLLFSEVNPIPVKAAMKLMGYDCGPCRMPLSPISRENLQKLKEYFFLA